MERPWKERGIERERREREREKERIYYPEAMFA
jgi:hypothetical protein